MIINILLFSLLCSLVCVAIYIAFNGAGMIFNSVSEYFDLFLPDFIKKPIYECLICMGSFWALIVWTYFVQKYSEHIPAAELLPIVILVTCGINTIFSVVVKKILNDEA